jgi:hypothetical protein
MNRPPHESGILSRAINQLYVRLSVLHLQNTEAFAPILWVILTVGELWPIAVT